MKREYFVKLLSVALSLIMVCGVFSPMMVSATASNVDIGGLQKFIDEGSHAQLVECPDAVYMEYAEKLRTDSVAVHTMHLLGLIYGGLFHNDKIEPDKDLYKQALLNIIRTYEAENAESITQQSLMDDTKELADYLLDVADVGLSWIDALDANIEIKTGEGVISDDISLAVAVIQQIPNDTEDWAKGVCTLKTVLQLYEEHDIFLRAVEKNADGELKEAARELRIDQSKVVKAHLQAYGDLLRDSSEDYAKLFIGEIWVDEWIDYIKDKLPSSITSVLSKIFNAAKLGVDIGKLAGNILVKAEDVLSYIVEIKAMHDISIILENEMESVKTNLRLNSSAVTETDIQNYITYGNYLISSRVRGQYCMTAIYLQPSLLSLFRGDDIENAKNLYNRLTSNLLSLKGKLGEIIIDNASPVVDAVNYEKDVIVDPSLADFWDPSGLKHQIKIPKISINTAAAQVFNKKIYNNHCYGYEELLLDQEENQLYACEYEYKVYKDVVAIAVHDGIGAQCGGVSMWYKVYYYSLAEDRELTFDEYFDAIGIAYDVVLSKIMDSDDYKDAMSPYWELSPILTDCLIDENGIIAYLENVDTMDGWMTLEISSVIEN